MKLNEYLIKNRLAPEDFAYESSISISSIYRYLRGKKMHRNTAKKIEKFTEGHVSYEELMEYDKVDK